MAFETVFLKCIHFTLTLKNNLVINEWEPSSLTSRVTLYNKFWGKKVNFH